MTIALDDIFNKESEFSLIIKCNYSYIWEDNNK